MPVQFIKVQPNPATAQRVAEANEALLAFGRAMAPAVQKACAEIGRAFEQIRTQRPA
jgi:hypothetical protein